MLNKVKAMLAKASEKYYIHRIVIVMSVLVVIVVGFIALCIGYNSGNAIAEQIMVFLGRVAIGVAVIVMTVVTIGLAVTVIGMCVVLSDY